MTDHDDLFARADGFARIRGYGYTAVPLVEDLIAALRAEETETERLRSVIRKLAEFLNYDDEHIQELVEPAGSPLSEAIGKP